MEIGTIRDLVAGSLMVSGLICAVCLKLIREDVHAMKLMMDRKDLDRIRQEVCGAPYGHGERG